MYSTAILSIADNFLFQCEPEMKKVDILQDIFSEISRLKIFTVLLSIVPDTGTICKYQGLKVRSRF